MLNTTVATGIRLDQMSTALILTETENQPAAAGTPLSAAFSLKLLSLQATQTDNCALLQMSDTANCSLRSSYIYNA